MKKLVFGFLFCFAFAHINAQWKQTSGPECSSMAVLGNTLFIGTPTGVYMTSDSGNTWIARNKGIQNTIISSLAINGSKIFVGTDAGGNDTVQVYNSNDSGLTWNLIIYFYKYI